MIPFDHQVVGAKFLAARQAALLADDPRCGKTGAAIMAADMVLAKSILVVTTASGRPVWRRALGDWSVFRRPVTILDPARWHGPWVSAELACVITSWKTVTKNEVRAAMMAREWDLVILDECHYAKNFETQRTQAVYGHLIDDGDDYSAERSAIQRTKRVWLLSGTPAPNSVVDIYPHLRALRPACLRNDGFPQAIDGHPAEWPDVLGFERFLKRYAVVGYKKLSKWNKVRVIIRGQNEPELRQRIGDFMLRRTQQDVGITEPIYEIMPLTISRTVQAQIERDAKVDLIVRAAQEGRTADLEMHLSKVRRFLGEAKAPALVEALKEEFECGLDKIVIMAWHKDVIAQLLVGLEAYGARAITGSTTMAERERNEIDFRTDPDFKVLIGQIQAAGEAIDLSAAAELIFCESSTVPKDMKQASLRITNHTQTRTPRVRVAVLDGSFDDQVETILLRKWASIKEVIG